MNISVCMEYTTEHADISVGQGGSEEGDNGLRSHSERLVKAAA